PPREVRRPLLRGGRAVRPKLPPGGRRPTGARPAGHRAGVRADRRQYLPGGDAPGPAVLPAAGARLGELPYAGTGALPVWVGGAPGRRRDRGRRPERGARDAAGLET